MSLPCRQCKWLEQVMIHPHIFKCIKVANIAINIVSRATVNEYFCSTECLKYIYRDCEYFERNGL